MCELIIFQTIEWYQQVMSDKLISRLHPYDYLYNVIMFEEQNVYNFLSIFFKNLKFSRNLKILMIFFKKLLIFNFVGIFENFRKKLNVWKSEILNSDRWNYEKYHSEITGSISYDKIHCIGCIIGSGVKKVYRERASPSALNSKIVALKSIDCKWDWIKKQLILLYYCRPTIVVET